MGIMKSKQGLVIPVIFILITISSLAAMPKHSKQVLNNFVKDLLSKIKKLGQERPEDRVYLHCDKPFYKPSETIWFSVYVRNGSDLKNSKKSGIVHVELMNPKGGIEKKIQIIAKNGVAKGAFDLDEQTVGGLYKIKAYTKWQLNDPDPAIFEKTIQVQKVILPRLKMKLDFVKKAYGAGDEVAADLTITTNANQALENEHFGFRVQLKGETLLTKTLTTNQQGEALIKFNLPNALKTNDGLLNVMVDYQGQMESISRAIPIVLNNIQVQLFPEGGDLVAGLSSKVAFRAVNEFGKPADIEGIVVNSKGEKLTRFSSYHQGMGAFSLTPQANETYTVKITKPVSVTQTFEVPEALDKGYGLEITKKTKKHLFFKIHSTQKDEVFIVAQVRGKKFFATKYRIKKGSNLFSIPLNKFPIGVAQITLFDSLDVARAERLVFVNQHKQLNIQVKTNKEKYLPREKVKMTINVTDENGMPMPADLSLAVADDQLLTFADDKSSNILSWLLMESDIKDKVEEPNFYFDPKEEKAALALDYLLMTSGWRRFTWKTIDTEAYPPIAHLGERADIGGVLSDGHTGKKLKGVTVKLNVNGQEQVTTTNKKGVYKFTGVDLSQTARLSFERSGYRPQNQYVQHYTTSLYSSLWPKPSLLSRLRSSFQMNRRKKAIVPSATNDGIAMRQEVEAMEEIDFGGVNLDMMVAEDVLLPPVGAEVPAKIPVAPKNEIAAKPKIVGRALRKPSPKPLIKADKTVVRDRRMGKKKRAIVEDELLMEKEVVARGFIKQAPRVTYYRAKEFATPIYPKNQKVAVRDDFRSTIYWNGHIAVDRRGKAKVEFYTSDAITSFKVTAEGIGQTGLVGRAEHKFYSQLPFSLTTKLPAEVVTEDVIKIPLTLVNNTESVINGALTVQYPNGLKPVRQLPTTVNLPAQKATTQYLAFEVMKPSKADQLKIVFKGNGFDDAIEQDLTIIPKGFPVIQSFSGSVKDKTYNVKIDNLVKGSITAKVTAYPSPVGELISGLESMLREPHGCFEQTSSSTYPNILVLNYLIQTEQSNPKIAARAKQLIAKGYKRLTSFESKGGGFEWFGGNPAHEGLTAYGLMEFMDMQAVYDGVDQEMVARTAEWLMDRKDGKGGYQRNARALHRFGVADNNTMSLYITWALTEAKYTGLEKEVEFAYQTAKTSKNPYQLGLAANILYNQNDTRRAKILLEQLMSIQLEGGAWEHQSRDRSAPGSGGKALRIETAALALSALLKQNNPHFGSVQKCAEFLRNSRGGYGGFGNTNSTVLALRALVQYAIFSKRTDEAGTIAVYVNGEQVKTKTYDKDTQDEIILDGLGQYLTEKQQAVRVQYLGLKNPLPYTLSVDYHTVTPNSNEECVIALETKLANTNVKVGETVRLTTTLRNTSNKGQPMPLAIVGLPAGLSAQPWQLKELVEKKQVDFYEVIGNNIVFYYRGMAANQSHQLHLDLKADIAGTYTAPASSAYLYYMNEYKNWTALEQVNIEY